jgi:hypothetical protein
MEFIFALLGFIVLLGFGLAFAAHKLREDGECLSTKPQYCCYCGNRLSTDPVTQATDAAVHADS